MRGIMANWYSSEQYAADTFFPGASLRDTLTAAAWASGMADSADAATGKSETPGETA